jgi:hypothetical protein
MHAVEQRFQKVELARVLSHYLLRARGG